MIPKFSINAILDALASQQQHGETSLIVTIEPDLIQDAMNALRAYRKIPQRQVDAKRPRC